MVLTHISYSCFRKLVKIESFAFYMAALFTLIEALDASSHQYRAFAPDKNEDWFGTSAAEYVRLRTQCKMPLEDVSVDGITVLDITSISERLRKATVPRRRTFTTKREMNFDVIRSDFGETLCYMLLEQEYKTRFGYQSVCDRELIQLPGRGLDAVGIEDGSPLTLVLGETKVSDERASPPQVVDRTADCLRAQHTAHLTNLQMTANKIWNMARHVIDVRLRALYFLAASYLENRLWEKLHVVVCCVLVRPRQKYTKADYGSFRNNPTNYAPADVRFLVICLPEDVEPVLANWFTRVQAEQSS